MDGRRLMIFDRTCGGWGRPVPFLSESWWIGGAINRARGKLDATYAASSWEEALEWLAGAYADEPIAEIQFWGHGKWGRANIDGIGLGPNAVEAGFTHARHMQAIAERMHGGSRWWFRSCETIGGNAGHDFAQRWSDYFGCAIAGHTYIIGPWQSGLHVLQPGQSPSWSAEEGIREGSADDPRRAFWSTPWAPNTINCLRTEIPRRITTEAQHAAVDAGATAS